MSCALHLQQSASGNADAALLAAKCYRVKLLQQLMSHTWSLCITVYHCIQHPFCMDALKLYTVLSFFCVEQLAALH